MVFPKVIYENLPFGYFIVSAYLLSMPHDWLIMFSAGLFYSAACIVLVTRSSYRRLDRHSSVKRLIPEFIYEYLPFTYTALAIFMLLAMNNPIYQFIAYALIVISLRNLICRHNNRKKSDALFK